MSTHKIAAISSAVALSVAAAAAQAVDNPFELKTLGQGYQVADADKATEGKCSDGKCSAEMKNSKDSSGSSDKAKHSHHHDKAKDGSSAEKMKDGSCSADKMKDGSCHSSK
jgi:uncharacterized low-complexity protein